MFVCEFLLSRVRNDRPVGIDDEGLLAIRKHRQAAAQTLPDRNKLLVTCFFLLNSLDIEISVESDRISATSFYQQADTMSRKTAAFLIGCLSCLVASDAFADFVNYNSGPRGISADAHAWNDPADDVDSESDSTLTNAPFSNSVLAAASVTNSTANSSASQTSTITAFEIMFNGASGASASTSAAPGTSGIGASADGKSWLEIDFTLLQDAYASVSGQMEVFASLDDNPTASYARFWFKQDSFGAPNILSKEIEAGSWTVDGAASQSHTLSEFVFLSAGDYILHLDSSSGASSNSIANGNANGSITGFSMSFSSVPEPSHVIGCFLFCLVFIDRRVRTIDP